MARDTVAADIFISYAREDTTFARRLQQGIQTGGLSVWMDTASMTGGERWTQEIESAIQNAPSVVVAVSPSSNESIWVRREVLYAQQLGKRIFPVLVEQAPLPAPLIDLNALALHEDFAAGLDRLLTNLREEVPPAAPGSGAAREQKLQMKATLDVESKGDGKADLWQERHAIRYATYLLGVPLIGWLGARRSPWFWGLFLLGGAIYARRPVQRLLPFLPKMSLRDKVAALAVIPVIRVVGDVAKMGGYPVGVWWRLTSGEAKDWRDTDHAG